jgi:crotonobetainyl-CoA:carnitine CoA-transferase CaiB-like acyl-CoA transferase
LKSISEKPGEKTSLLDGMKVVSFCHYLQGPAAMQYLADMGAEVIKIEPPNGAFERHWAGADRATVGAVSALFLYANRNVRSLAIDLRRREPADIVFRLIEQSHVLAENFRPLTLDRLGFGYDAVRHNDSFCTVPVNGENATLVSHPVRYDGKLPPFRCFALAPGADSRSILADAGFSSKEVAELIHDKVVFEPEGV